MAVVEQQQEAQFSRKLPLVDTIWTAEERDKICNHPLSDLEMTNLFNSIGKSARNGCHVLKKKTPKTLEPARNASSAMHGVTNNLTLIPQKELDKHVPDWKTPPHRRQMPCTFLTVHEF